MDGEAVDTADLPAVQERVAAFPEAYATVLSGFYLPVIVVLLSLIGRAISIEF